MEKTCLPFDPELLNQTVTYQPAAALGYSKSESSHKEIQAIFYDGVPYQGKDTKYFAYLGIPKDTAGKKLPAMVLVHGGGGTAFDCWVKKWTDRGYVAISMDLTGTHPPFAASREEDYQREPHCFGGPDNDRYGVIAPKEDVWMYHAVIGTIFAHNLLRSLPCVDTDRIGITGTSWGGVVTSTAIGIDQRYAFAIPVFGCGYLYLARGYMSTVMTQEKIEWDPSNFLPHSTMPTFWINGDRDSHFDVSIFSASARLGKGKAAIALKPGFSHSHYHAWELCPELYAYADSMLKNGTPLISFGEVQVDGVEACVSLQIPEGRKLEKIRLVANISNDVRHFDPEDPAFVQVEGTQNGNTFTFSLPENTLRFYISAWDQEGNVTSTFVTECAQ